MSVEIDPLTIQPTAIEGLSLISPKSVTDERGTVREFFRLSGFAGSGLPIPERWTQINLTWTRHGAIRGLHGEAMTKLVGVAYGQAFGVYVDARTSSPTYGQVVTATLSVGDMVLVPPGVCNGFQATSVEGCQYLYCFDEEWRPGMPGVAISPLDAALAISWPIEVDPADRAQVSAKDVAAPTLAAAG